jgi:tetratricopeptide (TPR) repeat protein
VKARWVCRAVFILGCAALLSAPASRASAQGDPLAVCLRHCDDAPSPAPPRGDVGTKADHSAEQAAARRRDTEWSQEEGQDYLNRKDWDNAIRSFEEALDKDPDNDEIAALLTRARAEKAAGRAAAVAGSHPGPVPVPLREALGIVQAAQAHSEALSFNAQGIESLRIGDFHTAVSLFEIGVEKAPKDTVLRQNLAVARAENAKVPAALSFARGRQAYAGGDWLLAYGLLNDAVSKQPGNAQFQRTLAVAKKKAMEELSPAPARSSVPRAWDDAIVGVYGHAPDGVLPRVRNGFEAMRRQDPTTAREAFVSALGLDPGNTHIKGLIASIDGSATPPVLPLTIKGSRPDRRLSRFPAMGTKAGTAEIPPTLLQRIGMPSWEEVRSRAFGG